MRVVAGFDCGGTKTTCAVIDERGSIVGLGYGGPANPNFVNLKRVKKSILEAALNGFREAGVSKVDRACIGMAGMVGVSRSASMERFLRKLALADHLKVVLDTVVAHVGAFCFKPGIVMISGTGSIAYGVGESGKEAMVGGWGTLIGDEGSAFDVARKGLIATVRSYDGRGRKTILEELMKEKLKITDAHMRESIIRLLYVKGMPRHEFAKLALLVMEAGKRGDAVALEILEEAGKELALAAATVSRQLALVKGEVTLIGGFWEASRFIIQPLFEKELKRLASDIEFVEPKLPPVCGAGLYALREEGVKIDYSTVRNLRETYDRKRLHDSRTL